MNRAEIKIAPMRRVHVRACAEIVAASDPWKRLGIQPDFSLTVSRKNPTYVQAHVSIVENKAVGFIIFIPEPVFAQGGYIRAVGVAPYMRGRGIGGKLLSFAEKIIAKKSPNVYLCVSSFNRRAQAFYKRERYVKVGKIPDLVIRGASEYIYRKRLRPPHNAIKP